MIPFKSVLRATVVACVCGVSLGLSAAPTHGQVLAGEDEHGLPNYDIRFGPDGVPAAGVREALVRRSGAVGRAVDLEGLRGRVEDLRVDDDPLFGTPRFVRSWSRLLTQAAAGVAPRAVVRSFIAEHMGLFEIDAAEIDAAKVVRDFTDEGSGITHLTLQQQIGGVDLFEAEVRANVMGDGRLINVSSTMLARPAVDFPAWTGRLSDLEAIRSAAKGVGVEVTTDPTHDGAAEGESRKQRWENSRDFRCDRAIVTERVFFPMTREDIRAAWRVVIPTRGVGHTYEIVLDANDGTVLFRVDELHFDSYRVYTGVGVSIGCASRSLVVNPNDATASPFGWHDTNGVAGAEFTDTRGNNVDVHLDVNADNLPDPVPPRPDGGASLVFDFPIDFTLPPSSYQSAVVTQAYYYANVFHDTFYKFGFTEAAGNFQTNNYGHGGLENDAIQFDIQDGSGTNNGNFSAPADGTAGRCQMYIFNLTSPNRDAALDNTVVFHELGHGVTRRLTGGPANSNALNAVQSAGMDEGWGDFIGIWMSSQSSDTQGGAYPLGNYVLGLACNGPGIRRKPYSYDMSIDPLTFDAYGTSGTTAYGIVRSTQIHNTGEIWASALWDLNWLLINKYGYDSNRYTGWTAAAGPGHAGNKIVLKLIVDALKLQPANPSFTQARDAIIAADIALNGGADLFEIWSAFVRRGLGVNASTASSSSTVITIDFTYPPTGACCQGTVCTMALPASCTGAGVYQGNGTACGAAGNPTTCCRANFNGVGGVTVADIFAFLSAWFAGNPSADFNNSGGLPNVQDIFAFLSAWFASCA